MSARASRTSTRRRRSCARMRPSANSSSRTARWRRRELEDKVGAFYDGKYDILLSTAIVESGLDIPRANTMIVHRADMFGLAQLYQLRGRVGRSKIRAYAYFTTPGQGQDHAAGGEAPRRCCNRSTRWAPAFSSRATTSTCAAPATFWAKSSPATSRKSATSFISRWCARRSSASSRARTRRPRTCGRRPSSSARR